jgi:ketosteroid isomerase-like protein
MMDPEGIEVLRAVGDAFNRRDIDATLAGFAPDAEWQQAREDPDATTLRGVDAIRRQLERWLEVYPDLRIDALERIVASERVFVWVRIGGRGVASGIDVEMEEAYVYTLRNGRIARVEEYFDRDEALAAAGITAETRGRPR